VAVRVGLKGAAGSTKYGAANTAGNEVTEEHSVRRTSQARCDHREHLVDELRGSDAPADHASGPGVREQTANEVSRESNRPGLSTPLSW